MNAPTGTVAAIAQTIHRHVTQLDPSPSWIYECAAYVTGLPVIQMLLEDSQAVAELHRTHIAKVWSPESSAASCAACGQGWPCHTYTTINRGQQ